MGTRTNILNAARRLHDHHGDDGVSMRNIAAELGVSATAIYRHYRNKEAIMAAVVEQGFALLHDYLTRDGRPDVLDFMQRFLDFALDEPRLYDVMFLRARRDIRRYPEDFAAHKSSTFDAAREAVEREMRDGKLRRDNTLEATLTIWSHAHGLISMFTLGRFGDDAAAFRLIYRRAIRRLYRGIAAPKPKGAADENRPPRRRSAAAVRRVRAKR
jgi:AcrR family transcriptional regulator